MQRSQTARHSWAVPVPHRSGLAQLLKAQVPPKACWGDETKGSLAHRVPLLAGLAAAAGRRSRHSGAACPELTSRVQAAAGRDFWSHQRHGPRKTASANLSRYF